MMTRSQVEMVVAYLCWKPWQRNHAVGWRLVHGRGLRVLALLAPLLGACGGPFTSSLSTSLTFDGGESVATSGGTEPGPGSFEAGTDAGEVRGDDAATETAAPLRDVLADPWPADVVVEPWPCTNCVPTFSGVMACCQGTDPNRTCNGHEGARYCAGCGCPP